MAGAEDGVYWLEPHQPVRQIAVGTSAGCTRPNPASISPRDRALMAPGTHVVLELTNVVADGDQVVAEWTSRATARNGGANRNRNAGIFTVRDGRIVSVREYVDTQHVAQVLFPVDQSGY